MAIGWIKVHAGIPGNEAADVAAKRGAGMEEGVRVTPADCGVELDQVLAARKKSRYRRAWGGGTPLTWSRKACTAYTRLRTGRGNIGSWREKVGTGGLECRRCGEDEIGETIECFGARRSRGRGGNPPRS